MVCCLQIYPKHRLLFIYLRFDSQITRDVATKNFQMEISDGFKKFQSILPSFSRVEKLVD